jgi:hypothetical protein
MPNLLSHRRLHVCLLLGRARTLVKARTTPNEMRVGTSRSLYPNQTARSADRVRSSAGFAGPGGPRSELAKLLQTMQEAGQETMPPADMLKMRGKLGPSGPLHPSAPHDTTAPHVPGHVPPLHGRSPAPAPRHNRQNCRMKAALQCALARPRCCLPQPRPAGQTPDRPPAAHPPWRAGAHAAHRAAHAAHAKRSSWPA